MGAEEIRDLELVEFSDLKEANNNITEIEGKVILNAFKKVIDK